jgi:hypothetical protein
VDERADATPAIRRCGTFSPEAQEVKSMKPLLPQPGAVAGLSERAADGIRTHDLLHGKTAVACASVAGLGLGQAIRRRAHRPSHP